MTAITSEASATNAATTTSRSYHRRVLDSSRTSSAGGRLAGAVPAAIALTLAVEPGQLEHARVQAQPDEGDEEDGRQDRRDATAEGEGREGRCRRQRDRGGEDVAAL